MGYRTQDLIGGCGWIYYKFMIVFLEKMRCQSMKIGGTREALIYHQGYLQILLTHLHKVSPNLQNDFIQ
jgi:hypothetical protein